MSQLVVICREGLKPAKLKYNDNGPDTIDTLPAESVIPWESVILGQVIPYMDENWPVAKLTGLVEKAQQEADTHNASYVAVEHRVFTIENRSLTGKPIDYQVANFQLFYQR